ncbi:hypothetical protein Dsin_016514 [Dipteronia sinensis]|uniref:Uncharacterized protein n=1 Tax=Dipteronia sinensis TaxID=43782 RepID=A0AAE0E713_9ROSI|nr:hypothetical protein Dsin_016514 [Dipteronia sinensis]
MARRDRWKYPPQPPPDPVPSEQVKCCCSWFKPKSKSSDPSNKRNENSYAPKPEEEQGKATYQKEYSNGNKKLDERRDARRVQKGQGNQNSWFVPELDERRDAPKWQGTVDNMQPNDSSGFSRDQRVIPKINKYTENDPVETTKNGALQEFKGKQVWTHDQENSDGIPRNMKPSPQNHKFSSPGQVNKQEEIKKKGKHTGPNSTNVTKRKNGGYSSEEKQRSNVPNEEDNNSSHGGTRPDPIKNKGKGNNGSLGATRLDPTKSCTVEQAGPWNDRIKNRKEDILEDHQKALQKPEYNHGINRDTGLDLNIPEQQAGPRKEKESNHIKNTYENVLEQQNKVVHKPEYKKESSSPEQAGIPKRREKQGINTNHEYTNPHNPSTTIAGREEKRKDSPMH